MEASDTKRIVLQVVNCVAFFIAMLFNGLSPVIMPFSLTEITDDIDARIEPAGYAFSIWGVIYSLLGVFTVYQAIPDVWIGDYRNNELIFDDVGVWFSINMLINSIWLIIFQTGNVWGFLIGLFDIIAMLATDLYIMMRSTRAEVNIVEAIGLRGGFTIYSGWVTAATILNATFVLKKFGLA